MTSVGVLGSRADLVAYAPLAVATTAAAVLGRERTHLVTKVLLAPTLAAGVVTSRRHRPGDRNATLLVALAGSTAGDWLMNAASGEAVPARRRVLMRRGAAAFAVQQVGLVRLLLRDGVRLRPLPTALVGGVLATLAVVDTVSEGGQPDAALTGYGVLLGAMAALALGDRSGPLRRRSVALGGALFLLSDATIILGDHVAGSPGRRAVASGVVLSTYAVALALLVHGLRDEPAPLTSRKERP